MNPARIGRIASTVAAALAISSHVGAAPPQPTKPRKPGKEPRPAASYRGARRNAEFRRNPVGNTKGGA